MRESADATRIREFAQELGKVAPEGTVIRRERSPSRFRAGNGTVSDFDLYSQALSKLERGFELDIADVRAMVEHGLVDPDRLRRLFAEIEDDLFRFPAVDAATLRRKVAAFG